MSSFHERLSENSVYQRYFRSIHLNERIAHARLSRLCFIDYDREIALVAESPGQDNKSGMMIGIGRLVKEHFENAAELAILVSDAFQGKGLGSELTRRLLAIAADEGIGQMRARILPDNLAMQNICKKMGFHMEESPSSGEVTMSIECR